MPSVPEPYTPSLFTEREPEPTPAHEPLRMEEMPAPPPPEEESESLQAADSKSATKRLPPRRRPATRSKR
jgi:hypothetical protein